MLALVSVTALPLLVLNELTVPMPLYKFSLLKRRNLAFGLVTLFTFLILNLSASTIPIDYLTEVSGFRPLQSYVVTLLIAVPQIVLLPLVAVLLNFESVDGRVVIFAGICLRRRRLHRQLVPDLGLGRPTRSCCARASRRWAAR